ncbi:hypothetical protein AYJ66_11140 [Dietzia cinnamea]|nr:hypothetical protein AYJ66_11140 [Dietzia cinnamea]
MPVETRTLPVWEPHSHPTHELLWNRAGASTATVGTAPAGTWYRTAHVDPRTDWPLPGGPVAVEMTPLLTLLLERLVDQSLEARSRELTEQMVFDLLEPSPHALLVQRPGSELLRPIVTALEASPGDPRSLTE